MRTSAKYLAGRRLASAFLIAAGWLGATNKGPDSGSYTATDATVYSFIDPAGGGSAPSVLTGTDDGGTLLTLPFSFQFYGQSYTSLCVSSNGIAYFVSANSTFCGSAAQIVDFANTDPSSTAVPGDLPAIAPFWMDLRFDTAGAGAVYYQTVGTAPNRQFVIEWYNAFPRGTASPVTFEAILNEGTNNVVFQYQTANLGGDAASNGGKATVGMRNTAGNTNGQEIEWSFDSAVLSNNYAILFTAPSGTATSVNTIATSPSGIPITVDTNVLSTPGVVYWNPNSSHILSAPATQTSGGTQVAFASWSTNATTPSINVTAGATGTTYTATFNTQYQLTTAASPANEGSVNGNGTFVTANNSITVTATPTAPYVFKYFTVNGVLTGSTNPQNLLMDGPKNVTAVFGANNPCSVSSGVSTTIQDVQAFVDQALGKASAGNDLNGDHAVNISDVQIAINAVLFGTCTL